MAADMRRVIIAAAQAALDEAKAPAAPKPRKRRLPAGRALLIGAGLVTAGRATLGGRGRHLLAGVQDRIYEFEESVLSENGANGHDEVPETEDIDEE